MKKIAICFGVVLCVLFFAGCPSPVTPTTTTHASTNPAPAHSFRTITRENSGATTIGNTQVLGVAVSGSTIYAATQFGLSISN